jgi:hypothetical protein
MVIRSRQVNIQFCEGQLVEENEERPVLPI